MNYNFSIRRMLKIIISLIIIMFLCICVYIYISFYKLSYVDNEYVECIDKDVISITNDDNNLGYDEKIHNILIIGLDTRENQVEEASRSDAMMILTIDERNEKLKITSLMRDTYAKIPGYEDQKLNHAYAYGEAELLTRSIEATFDLKIRNYVIIDFKGFKNIIDTIGGIEVTIDEEHLEDINDCIYGIEKKNIVEVGESGVQKLNGMQALAYARMRHSGEGTYDRVARQREVVELVMKKVKETSPRNYIKITADVLRSIKTNIKPISCVKLLSKAYKINEGNLEQLQIPAKKLSESVLYEDKGWVILMDRENNSKVLREFIYDDIPYEEGNYDKFEYKKSSYYRVKAMQDRTVDIMNRNILIE